MSSARVEITIGAIPRSIFKCEEEKKKFFFFPGDEKTKSSREKKKQIIKADLIDSLDFPDSHSLRRVQEKLLIVRECKLNSSSPKVLLSYGGAAA
jgi:hypothetical protein